MTRTLSSTTCPLMASWCGYDRPVDPREDGEGWSLTQSGGEFTLLGPDGEVTFDLTEAKFIADVLMDAVRFAAADKSRRAAA